MQLSQGEALWWDSVSSAQDRVQDQLLQLSEPRLEVSADKARRDSSLEVNDLLAEAPAATSLSNEG